MTVINSRDLDERMGRGVDPGRVPVHTGGSQGAMEGNFVAQSDRVEVQQGHGARGSLVYDARELHPTGYYGGTIVSVSDAPPVEQAMDPNLAPQAAPGAPRTVAQLLAGLRLRPPG
jgi:hypothetical protein